MKKYQSVEIRIWSLSEDVITQSYGESETKKSFFDNQGFDIDW